MGKTGKAFKALAKMSQKDLASLGRVLRETRKQKKEINSEKRKTARAQVVQEKRKNPVPPQFQKKKAKNPPPPKQPQIQKNPFYDSSSSSSDSD